VRGAPPPSGISGFLKRIDAAVPAGLDVHLIVDNYATHKHPNVRAWLGRAVALLCPRHAELRFLAEPSRALVRHPDQPRIRRGSFASAKDLEARITAFVAAYNARSRPFSWTATADDILAKFARLCNVISGTLH